MIGHTQPEPLSLQVEGRESSLDLLHLAPQPGRPRGPSEGETGKELGEIHLRWKGGDPRLHPDPPRAVAHAPEDGKHLGNREVGVLSRELDYGKARLRHPAASRPPTQRIQRQEAEAGIKKKGPARAGPTPKSP